MWLSGQKQSVIVFITDYLSFLFLQTNTTASPSRDATRSTTYSVGLEVSPVCGIAVMVDGFEVLAGVGAGVGAATSFFLVSLPFRTTIEYSKSANLRSSSCQTPRIDSGATMSSLLIF